MVQQTIVLSVTPEEVQALKLKLEDGHFEWRSQPHAYYSARGGGHIATAYESGKLVVQGPDPATFLVRHLGRLPLPAAPEPPENLPSGTLTGSDECGKGDLFGPLVVVALRLEAAEADSLVAGGLAESKQLSDRRALELGSALRGRFRHSIQRIEPEEYNREYRRIGNLNAILTDLHGRALREAAMPGDLVVVDQFGPFGRMERVLRGTTFRLVQIPRGERVPAVAAASVVARAVFLEALAELSQEAGVELPKGAGDPADQALRELAKLHKREHLDRFAKTHFANVQRVLRHG